MKPFKTMVPFEKQTGQAVSEKRKKPVWSKLPARITGAFLARAVLAYGMAPFGIGFLGMERRFSPLSLISLGFTALGYACLGDRIFLRYIVAGLLWEGVLFLFGRKKELSLPGAILIVTGITICLDFTQMLWLGVDTKILLLPISDAILIPLAMLLFDRCRRLLYERNLSAAVLTKQEKICFCGMVAICLLGFRSLRIPELFSAANYLGFLFLGIAAVCGGSLCSVSVGLAIGLLFGISGDLFSYLAVFGGTAFVCGILGKDNKVEAAGLLCLCGTALCFYGLWNGTEALQLPEPVLAAVTLVLLPRGFFRSADRFLNFSQSEKEKDGFFITIQTQLRQTAEAFRVLARTFTPPPSEPDSHDFAAMLDAACDHVCRGCPQHHFCHKEDFDALCDALVSCIGRLRDNHLLTGEDVFLAFQGRCKQTAPMARELNRLFGEYRSRCLQKNALTENRFFMGEQYRNLAGLLQRLSASAKDETAFLCLAAEEVQCRFMHENIPAEDVRILRRADGSRTVQLRCTAWDARICHGICAVLHRVLGVSFSVSEEPVRRGRSYRPKFHETPLFTVSVGYARSSREEPCGDAFCVRTITGGKFAAFLSDGIGTGDAAHRESETLVTLLDAFFHAGFDHEPMLKLINLARLMTATNDLFATLDLCILDLYSGEAEFIKQGAQPGYLRRGEEVRILSVESPPIGILPDANSETLCDTLQHGDTVVMTTDGLELKTGKGSWIKDMLTAVPASMPPQELADEILEKALTLKGGTADDDMSVLVLRPEKIKATL